MGLSLNDSTIIVGRGPLRKYKRYTDGKVVTCMLMERDGKKMMMVSESVGEVYTCPHCTTILNQVTEDSEIVSWFEPAIFHARHKPVD